MIIYTKLLRSSSQGQQMMKMKTKINATLHVRVNSDNASNKWCSQSRSKQSKQVRDSLHKHSIMLKFSISAASNIKSYPSLSIHSI